MMRMCILGVLSFCYYLSSSSYIYSNSDPTHNFAVRFSEIVHNVGKFASGINQEPVFGERLRALLGCNLHQTHDGVIPGKNYPDKVRITAINGILNIFEDALASFRMLSSVHGDVPVHYVYVSTEGFPADLLRCVVVKSGVVTSQQVLLLSKAWKRLIRAMGGVQGGGKIIHYAHSLGGVDTRQALQLLTEDERKMVHVYTFGSAVYLRSYEAGMVRNYVSEQDFISKVADLYGYFSSLCGAQKNVYEMSPHSVLLAVDHEFRGGTYRAELERLGREFQKQYLAPLSEDFSRLHDSSLSAKAYFTDHRDKKKTVIIPSKKKIGRLIADGKFVQLAEAVEKALRKTISYEELVVMAEEAGCSPLIHALRSAKVIQELDDMVSKIPLADLIITSLFIEVEIISKRARKSLLYSNKKSYAPYIVEYDAKSGYVFIHLRNDAIGYIGRGAHKLVLRSIIYSREHPEVVARCIIDAKTSMREVIINKKLCNKPGLLELKAIISRKRQGQLDKHEIFIKLYNAGTLSAFIGTQAHHQLTLFKRLQFAKVLIDALHYIHSKGYVHRDLHLGNYFLHRSTRNPDSLELVLGDYGQVLKLDECRDRIAQASRNYQAPESIIYETLSLEQYQRCDVYALGCVFYSIFYETRPPWFWPSSIRPPYPRKKPSKELLRRKKNLIRDLEAERARVFIPILAKQNNGEALTIWEQVQMLMFSMLSIENSARPTIHEVKCHVYDLLDLLHNSI